MRRKLKRKKRPKKLHKLTIINENIIKLDELELQGVVSYMISKDYSTTPAITHVNIQLVTDNLDIY